MNRLRKTFLLLLAVLISPMLVLAGPAATTHAQGEAVIVELVPNKTTVSAGRQVGYKIVVTNTTDKVVHNVTVTLPFNNKQIKVDHGEFKQANGDWISTLDQTDGVVVVSFGKLSEGKSRSGKLVFNVVDKDTSLKTIDLRASYSWGGAGGGDGKSKTVKVDIERKEAKTKTVKAEAGKKKGGTK